MLVACGGLEAIVELISSEYFHNPDLAPGLAVGGGSKMSGSFDLITWTWEIQKFVCF
jgi:hypothetical protein